MHGREGVRRKRRRLMCPVPASGSAVTVPAAAPHLSVRCPAEAAADSIQYSPDCFLKDRRKIFIGDCALLQAGKSSPFIGIIRWFSPGKKACLKVGVNRLYRPSDVKLAKGISLEAAPNEVFYSFHKDEISAELLLHPCKVVFLSKEVELPSGISSFVCRRVYDIVSKCLWWLTDKDYVNKHQEEVDQLLNKTRLEMHAAVQPGGRSPKPLNGPSSQQLKSGSDSVQNGASFSSQSNGKKKGEKGDQSSESKRECSSNADDRDPGDFRPDSMIKTEMAKVTDKGGLINNDAVEKLVQLMQLDRGERKIDLAGRLLLADVIASTSRNDCLGRFVQLRGVPVLDNWLQEAHRGKNGDGSPKEGDKSVEELLLALLRALDKLPVNLNALQTCHIGRSVNHLRSHKNLEIQKKARSLVDTWKKRVDAEMTKLEITKLSDAKSIGSSHMASWTGKPALTEVSHGGNRCDCSSEAAAKSSIAQPSTCKSLPVKIGHGDSNVKSNPASQGSLKWSATLSTSVASGTKDSQPKAGDSTEDTVLPLTIIKEEKSSAACQPQNHNQPCLNDFTKTLGTLWKEDTRSSSAGLINASKTSGGSSRHRKPSGGLAGTGFSGVLDGRVSKSSPLCRSTASDKVPQSGPAGEMPTDAPVVDHGNSHRLIVRLSNPGQSSPTRNTSGGSLEDPLTGSITLSSEISEKSEHIDRKSKLQSDVCQANISAYVNAEAWQIDDPKGLPGFDGGDRSPGFLDEELGTVKTGREMDVVKNSSEPKLKSFQASLSSINALIESCANHYEAGASSYSGDDLGMNLLASVAAGEMSKSELASPTGSLGESSVFQDPCTVNEVKSKFSSDDILTQPRRPEDNADSGLGNGSNAVSLQVPDETQHNGTVHLTNSFGDIKCTLPLGKTGEHTEQFPVPAAVSCKNAEPNATSESKLVDVATNEHVSSLTLPEDIEDRSGEDSEYKVLDDQKAGGPVADGLPDGGRKVRSPSSDGSKSMDCLHGNRAESSMTLSDGNDINHVSPGNGKCEKEFVEGNESCPLDKQNVMDEGLHDDISTEQPLPSTMEVCPDDASGIVDNMITASVYVNCSEVDESNKGKSDSMVAKSPLQPTDNVRKDHLDLATQVLNDRIASSVLSTSNQSEKLDKEVINHHSSASAAPEKPPVMPACESEPYAKSMGSKFSGAKAEVGKVAYSVEALSRVISPVRDTSARCDFDLNEEFSGDEGNTGEPVSSSLQECSSSVLLPNQSLFTVSPVSGGSSVPITVSAPAKGPFIPPEALLKSKGEPGWKGSAATSAFRPAEPRKVLGIPGSTSEILSYDAVAGKQSHPSLDIDLNVPDERILEDMPSRRSALGLGSESGHTIKRDAPVRSSEVLDLDLNRADESTDNEQRLASTRQSLGVPLLPRRPASGRFPLGEASVLRDFDLNNGPSLDVGVEQLPRGQQTKISTVPFLPSYRMNNNEVQNLSSWFPPGNPYPSVAIPSFLPDRDQPFPVVAAAGTQRLLGSSAGGGAFGSDLCGGSVLTSSQAMAFPPAAALTYPGFTFGSSFPLASTSFSGGLATYVDSVPGGGPCFPVIPTPLMGTVASAPSPYVRPFVISLPDGCTGGGSESGWKWGQLGLDLNTGPGSIDVEGRNERFPLTSRQAFVASSQAFAEGASSQAFAEGQARMYQPAGGGLKRKEPGGGWDAERLSHRPPSWQ